MNIYEKLMKSRCELIDAGIKKTGFNKFTKAEYYQLEDFLPKAQNIMLKNGLAGFCNIKESAKLTIIDFEKEESKLEFELEYEKATIKGALNIQNLGGTITYLRRYLWMLAFEITESDAIDSIDNSNKEPNNTNKQNTDIKQPQKTIRKCSDCKCEITEEQARLSIEKNNKYLCKNCSTDFSKIVQDILIKFELGTYFVACIDFLRNKLTKNNQSYFDFGKESGKWDAVIIEFLKQEINKLDPEFGKNIHEKSDIKVYADGLKILN